jgi:methyl-accepting chemotaxis protein
MSSEATTHPNNGWPNRRRQKIVDKPFQYRLIALLASIWAANSAFTVAIFYFYQEHLLTFYDLFPRDGVRPAIPLHALFPLSIVTAFLFGLAVVVIVGIYLTHHIAGPLYRIKVSLKRLATGDFNFQIKFRNRDFLQDFPGYFNQTLSSLKTQTLADVEALRTVEASLNNPSKALPLLRELLEKKETLLRTPGSAASPKEPERQPEPVH